MARALETGSLPASYYRQRRMWTCFYRNCLELQRPKNGAIRQQEMMAGMLAGAVDIQRGCRSTQSPLTLPTCVMDQWWPTNVLQPWCQQQAAATPACTVGGRQQVSTWLLEPVVGVSGMDCGLTL